MAGTRLSQESLGRALDHLCTYGDTDVFPHMIEIHFLHDKRDEVLEELSKLDLNSYNPLQAVEVLAPKSEYGFRIVHQLHFVDAILFTAAVVEIGGELENLKSPDGELGPFAYRFNPDGDSSLFLPGHTYKDWLEWQKNFADENEFNFVVFTDIADFYQRIYLHRIESFLDTATAEKGVNSFIIKVIKAIRSRQSYGIPVGGSAARMIAEAALSDSDAALLDEELQFSRFVDDFRIYIRSDQVPYQALSFLAEQLFLAEGLTLNGKKTFVMTKKEYLKHLEKELPDVGDQAEDSAWEFLVHQVYFSEEELDPEMLDKLKALNLAAELKDAILTADWDFGRIKAILKAFRITKSEDGADVLISNLKFLLPFAKEILLYFDELEEIDSATLNLLKEKIVELASDKSAKSVPIIHSWLLEFFVRGIIPSTHQELISMSGDGPLSEKQIHMIRGRNSDVNYFRRNKTRFEQLGSLTKFPFIIAASCLPKGEYEAWLGAIRGRMSGPLEKMFCDWSKTNAGKVEDLLDNRIVGTTIT